MEKGLMMGTDRQNSDLANGISRLPRLALRPKEAAKAIGIGETLLWSLTNRGEIPCVRMGNKVVVYPVAVLERFLAEKAGKGGRS